MLKKLTALMALSMLSSAAYAACPVGTTEHDVQLGGKTTCALQGVYKDDLYLSSSNSYVLKGGVFIGFDNGKGGSEMVLDPAILTIDPGTQIYALNPQKDLRLPEDQRVDRKDFLVISRGSKIIAKGTASAPIVFTSAQGMHIADSAARPERRRGDWGGLFLNGQAPSNKCADFNTCVLEGEAGTGYYGGNSAYDNSGILRYVRVEFGGDKINDEKEFNGVTFNGVGAGTVVEYVQVHKNNDDGIEFFGGTVDASHIMITGAGDDSIDWTDGYVGNLQFIVAIQDADDGDRGIEADSSKNVNADPRSNPTLSNITLIGSAVGTEGVKLRRATGVTLTNSVVLGFGKTCMESSDAYMGGLKIYNNIFTCNDKGSASDFANNLFLSEAELGLNGYLPSEDSILLELGQMSDDLGDFFEEVEFVGAFGDENWAEGWTTFVQK